MAENVSLLLGSGFSIPDGIKGVTEINQRLRKIDESEILIHSDMRAIFLNGQHDPNRFMNSIERLFVQEFINFYSTQVLSTNEEFHYEIFYDFYSDYLRGIGDKRKIEDFVDWFNSKFTNQEFHPQQSAHSRLDAFNRSFNQLLSQQIQSSKYFGDIGLGNYHVYDPFIRFLKSCIEIKEVKIHSLNHDILFEYLGKNHSDLFQHFSDGFELAGSPFFGSLSHTFNAGTDKEVSKSYKVRLARFTNTFNGRLALFKLHGSITSHKVHRMHSQEPGGRQTLRLKGEYGIGRYFEEYTDPKTGEIKFEYLWDEPDPDFLSGTTEKTRRYGEPYYKLLFDHFESNLQNAKVLIVIGYGFKDPIINEYLERNFLSKGKKMYVIGRSNPDPSFLAKYSSIFLNGNGSGLTGVSEREFQGISDYIK